MKRWLIAHAATISTVVLIVGILFQTGYLLQDYVLPWGWRVKQVWDKPRLTRSADLSLGAQATRIIEYINQVVPEDGIILLPPGLTDERFSLARSMQYFFFPRRLIQCGQVDSADCQRALASPDVYVIATDDFPPASAARLDFAPPPNNVGWFKGVYGPSFLDPKPAPEFMWIPWLGTLAGDLAILLGLAALGIAILLAIQAEWNPLDLAGTAVPVGTGVLAWWMFLLSWSGLRLTSALTAVAFTVLLLAAGLMARRNKPAVWHSQAWRRGWGGGSGLWRWLLTLAGLGLFGLAVAISIGTSYRLYDPVQIWSVKGYGIAHQGSIFAGADWGVHGLAYPLNIPNQVAVFFMADGDALPGSKFLYPLYGLGLCLSVFSFLRRQNVDERTAGLGSIFLGSVPIVFFHATSGFANLPFTFFLVAGALWGVESVRSDSNRVQWLVGLLLGLAAWTRPEGVIYAIAVVLILAIGRRPDSSRWRAFKTMLVPVLIVAGAWFAFAMLGGTLQGSNLQQAVSVYSADTLSGQFDLSGLGTIVKIFTYSMFAPYLAMFPGISATYWGVLFPVVLVLMAAGVGRFGRRVNPQGFLLYAILLCVAVINVGVFYVRSYSKPNFPAFIERAFPRAFLPTAVLMAVIALWGLGMMLQAWRRRSGSSPPAAPKGAGVEVER